TCINGDLGLWNVLVSSLEIIKSFVSNLVFVFFLVVLRHDWRFVLRWTVFFFLYSFVFIFLLPLYLKLTAQRVSKFRELLALAHLSKMYHSKV
ncbi:unnamed protein product, partial [Brassica rapa subsp. trilocularis]